MLPSVGERLGLAAAAARRLTDVVWRVYGRKELAHWTSACRPGGPYDLHLHEPSWREQSRAVRAGVEDRE